MPLDEHFRTDHLWSRQPAAPVAVLDALRRDAPVILPVDRTTNAILRCVPGGAVEAGDEGACRVLPWARRALSLGEDVEQYDVE